MTVIAFVGAAFSPGYYRRRRGGVAADPLEHCGLNVVVHADRNAWALSELRRREVERTDDTLVLGGSRLVRAPDGVIVEVDEPATPWTSAIRGTIRFRAAGYTHRVLALDSEGDHGWWPVAPRGSLEVELERPQLRFTASAYHDANAGSEPLESAFHGWTWSRMPTRDRTIVLYDVQTRSSVRSPIGLQFDDAGHVEPFVGPGPCALPPSWWGLPRSTRVDPGTRPALVRTLVDSPFYARTLIDTTLGGADGLAMHEVVDLGRFARATTQWMLPFRIRGVGWW